MGRAAKALTGLGDEAARGAAQWWKGGIKDAIKESESLAGQTTQQIMQGIDPNLLGKVSTEANAALQQGLASAHQSIKVTMESLATGLKQIPGVPRLNAGASQDTIKAAMDQVGEGMSAAAGKQKALQKQLDAMMNYMGKQDPGSIEKGLSEAISATRGEITAAGTHMENLRRAKEQLAKLGHAQELEDLLIKQDFDQIFYRIYSPDQTVRTYTSNLLGSNLTNLVEAGARSQKSISKNIGNSKAFLNEFIDLNLSGNKMGLDTFTANKQNAQKLLQMKKRHPELIAEIIAGKVTKIPMRKSLVGLTAMDTAKNLGIGTAAAAIPATIAGVTVYDWFGKNDPTNVVVKGKQTQGITGTLRATGPAVPIIQSVNTSLNNIVAISNRVNQDLSSSKGAAAGVTRYQKEMIKESNILLGALKQWDVVINNSQDPKQAESVGESLVAFLQSTANDIASLSSVTGVAGASGIARKTQTRGTNPDNLSKIQSFLGLGNTGKLDGATVKALRSLESRFNQRARTDAFTGKFVVPEVGHVVSYNDLATAYKKIQKYDKSELA